MPVYERGYKHWMPSEQKAVPSWWVIAKRGIAAPLKRRSFLLLLMVAWVPAIVKGVILYIKFRLGQLADLIGGSWADIDASGFLEFLKWQKYFIVILLAIIGARLIAKDRLENGLALYFARPISLVDYVFGKALIILFYYFMVTLFPIYALAIFGYLVTVGQTQLEMLISIPLRATLFCTASGLSMALILLALSSLGKREVYITVGWILLNLVTHGFASVMTMVGYQWTRIFDFPSQYYQAGCLLFGATPDPGYSPWTSLALLTFYTLLAVLILRHKIRPVEVV